MAGVKPRAGSYLELDLTTRRNSFDISSKKVLSPMTELTKSFENSLGRTPKRKLSMSGNDCPTPTAGGMFQRSLSSISNESGYFPDSPTPNFAFDSPSLEILKYNAEKGKQRRPSFNRWHSQPVGNGDSSSENKENMVLNFNSDEEITGSRNETGDSPKDGKFTFAEPKGPVRGKLPKPFSGRSFSDPSPQGQSRASFIPSSPSECSSQDSGTCEFDFDMDVDDDGFLDDLVQQQNRENVCSELPFGITKLVSAPLVNEESDNKMNGAGDTPRASESSYKPRDLFNAGRDRAYTVASGSPSNEKWTCRQRSNSFAIKRPNPLGDPSPNLRKKLRHRCMSVIDGASNQSTLPDTASLSSPHFNNHSPLRRSHSEPFEHGELGTLLDISGHKNMVGDFSGPYSLPSIPGQHNDLKCLRPETVARVLNNEYPTVEAHIIDCRYPYEYNGGHIKGAKNIYTKEQILREFLENPKKSQTGKKTILIFHCEFSSKRGPDMSRFLRSRDRSQHLNEYPKLSYPELYLIEGGYKAFFSECKEYCEPQCYLTMLDENHSQDLKRFSQFSKRSKSEGSILSKGFRPGLGYRR